MSGRIGVISLGCSKNLINTEQMMYLLKNAGYHVSGEIDGADIALLNTCGFIESAKAEAIETILELAEAKEEGRIGKIVVAGCLPQRQKDDILQELPEIDAIVGTGSFDDIVSVVKALTETKKKSDKPEYFGDIHAPVSETKRIITTSPIWAYLKIAEGCDNRCAYCCIPDIRGKFRSRTIENIVQEAKELTDRGTKELILVAQDLTRYGLDIYSERQLPKLLEELNKIEKLKWIRLHYLYPDKITDALIDVILKSDKILKYLDIPIQHINNEILNKMHRRGTGSEIRKTIKNLREKIPNLVLRTSLITGLPGEGEEEFNELYEFLKEAKIERAGVFAYSPEEGTPAASMDRPPTDIAVQRAERIMQLQSQIMQDWNNSRIGSEETVLIENKEAFMKQKKYSLARSYAESPDVDGYILIKGKSTGDTFAKVRITGIENGELVGERR